MEVVQHPGDLSRLRSSITDMMDLGRGVYLQ